MSAQQQRPGLDDVAEVRKLVERVDVVAEAAIHMAWAKGYQAGQRDTRAPLAKRMLDPERAS